MKHFLLLILFLPLQLVAQSRLALVIGNADYLGENGDLRTPVKDAEAMSQSLRDCGFEVFSYSNLNKERMDAAIFDFGKKLKERGGIALFYYSGHGVRYVSSGQIEPENFLIPTDFPEGASGVDLTYRAIPVSTILGQMQVAATMENILILDACRSYPPSKNWFKSGEEQKGLTPVRIPKNEVAPSSQGFFIGYATSAGSAANVGVRDLSPYTEALVAQLAAAEGEEINSIFGKARSQVMNAYPEQQPYSENKLNGLFYFKQGTKSENQLQYDQFRQRGDNSLARKEWLDARSYYQTALIYKTEDSYCKEKIKECDAKIVNIPKVVVDSPKDYPEIEMVRIEGGRFMMGLDEASFIRQNGGPQEKNLSSFSIGKYEITQKQWTMIMGSNPSKNAGCDSCPVENVSRADAHEFIKKLNQKSGKNYRLPSEAEWEYVAKGGGHGSNVLYSGAGKKELDKIAWHKGNSTHPVGQKAPNVLGVYDMTGNVEEWVEDQFDYYSPPPVVTHTQKINGKDITTKSTPLLLSKGWIVRGGSFNSASTNYHRKNVSVNFKQNDRGFRIASN